MITLRQIRDAGPCAEGWTTLLKGLGEATMPNLDREITIGDVAQINGREDALWCLRVIVDPRERVKGVIRAVDRASKHTKDKHVHLCVQGIKAWLASDNTVDLKALRVDAAASVGYAASAAAAGYAAYYAAAATAYAANAAAATAYATERALQLQDLIDVYGTTL